MFSRCSQYDNSFSTYIMSVKEKNGDDTSNKDQINKKHTEIQHLTNDTYLKMASSNEYIIMFIVVTQAQLLQIFPSLNIYEFHKSVGFCSPFHIWVNRLSINYLLYILGLFLFKKKTGFLL